jgi:hypothetical protein
MEVVVPAASRLCVQIELGSGAAGTDVLLT